MPVADDPHALLQRGRQRSRGLRPGRRRGGRYRPDLDYEHLFIDNASTDGTVADPARARGGGQARQGHREHTQLRPGPLALPRVPSGARRRGHELRRAIFRIHPSSSQSSSQKWREGYKVVIGVKRAARILVRRPDAQVLLLAGRRLSSDVELVHNFTGFGLYDREVVEHSGARTSSTRTSGALSAISATTRAEIPYEQPAPDAGSTKNDFFSLYDIAMLGVTNHSKVPLRVADDGRVRHLDP